MNIVVLAGGNSTEREVSIVSGKGVCGALRERNHRAILLDAYCGREKMEEDLFPAEYDIEKEAAWMQEKSKLLKETMKTRREFFGPYVLDICRAADIVFLALQRCGIVKGNLRADLCASFVDRLCHFPEQILIFMKDGRFAASAQRGEHEQGDKQSFHSITFA